MKQIIFSQPNVAELTDAVWAGPGPGEVGIRMAYTAISSGTERANLTGDLNVSGESTAPRPWPRILGYSGSGYVESLGDGVTDLKVGDRVVTIWGKHQQYITLPRDQVVRIDGPEVSMQDAAFTFISTFSLAAIRKTRLEIGESCMVVGLGLLGMFAVQYARIGGAQPVIAVDYSEERRSLALELGADYALDPSGPDISEKVRALTDGKGANALIEVTGNPDALNMSLSCAARYARVALLGCTRVRTTVDFYHDVHFPGITIIGAHTLARPEYESHPGWWTHTDDCKTSIRMLRSGRLQVQKMISEIHSPDEAPEVYKRLAFDKKFPVGALFNWNDPGRTEGVSM